MRLVNIENNECVLEAFDSNQRRRVQKIVAIVTGGNVQTTTRDNSVMPLSLYQGNMADIRLDDTHRGHLVALEFGGPEDKCNLVPMYGSFNSTGAWRSLEHSLKQWVDTKVGHVKLSITCQYINPVDPRIPTGFKVDVVTSTNVAFSWTINHPTPAPVRNQTALNFTNTLVAARTEMQQAGWLVENYLNMDNFPSYRRRPVFPQVPQNGNISTFRPYAMLDYLNWKSVKDIPRALTTWSDQIILAQTGDFSTEMREAIHQANQALHNGYLMSDDPTDLTYTELKYRILGSPAGALTDTGADTAAQVDHIIPRSTTGAASFSNAQILSAVHNNQKRAKMEQENQQAIQSVNRGTGRTKMVF